MKFAGVVVLYNPELTNLEENINSYLNKLDKLYVVDNSSKINEEITDKYRDNKKIEYIPLEDNLGIAYALNVGLKKAIDEEFDWLLTMDQDSKFEGKNFTEFIKFIENKSKDFEKTAIFSPKHVTMLYEFKQSSELTEKVLDVMTSGNFVNLKLAKEIGYFRDELFIDAVDTEYCFRANKMGFEVRIVNDIELKHNLGNEKVIKILHKRPLVYNYNFIRRYYITRNTLLVCEEYKDYFPEKCKFIKGIILKTNIKAITLEDNKMKKIKSIFTGYFDYKNKRLGKKFK